MGKSAQFPLHVWLPDAMEGPTPVSALIHAATMVTAGVYLVARCDAAVHARAGRRSWSSPAIGATTALLAALIALTQTDLKRVLAYSTVSQLGYMFMALGAGVGGGGSGDGRGDGRHVPLVHARILQGAVVPRRRQRDALDGRRDRHAALQRPAEGAADHALDVPVRRGGAGRRAAARRASGARTRSSRCSPQRVAACRRTATYLRRDSSGSRWSTALLTAFYTFRAYFMTFWGDERFPGRGGPPSARRAAGDGLAAADPGRVCARRSGSSFGPTHLFADYLHHTPGHVARRAARLALGHHDHERGAWARSGIALAWWFYVRSPGIPAALARGFRSRSTCCRSTSFTSTRFLCGCSWRRCGRWRWLSNWFDATVVDRIVDGVGRVPIALSRVPVYVHNGLVSTYSLMMLAGVVGCVLVVLRMVM